MPNNLLGQFYNDEHTREAVKDFLVSNLEDMAIERVFSKKDISGIADAKDVIEKAFIKLSEIYSPVEKTKVENNAR